MAFPPAVTVAGSAPPRVTAWPGRRRGQRRGSTAPSATSCAGATSAGCCGTRLLGQFGDGVFQAALAGTVLFNPQRAADPVDVAAGFAILLLPYSLVGPFAGVWLDRWSRRQVLLRRQRACARGWSPSWRR